MVLIDTQSTAQQMTLMSCRLGGPLDKTFKFIELATKTDINISY